MDVSVLAQYGAVGFIAAGALLAVKVLFGRLERQYAERDRERDAEVGRANARADRLEAELSTLYSATRDSLRALTAANQAVAEALARQRRDR